LTERRGGHKEDEHEAGENGLHNGVS
jgi:hypothetical protein